VYMYSTIITNNFAAIRCKNMLRSLESRTKITKTRLFGFQCFKVINADTPWKFVSRV